MITKEREMNTKERIRMIRLAGKIKKQPEYARAIGVNVGGHMIKDKKDLERR